MMMNDKNAYMRLLFDQDFFEESPLKSGSQYIIFFIVCKAPKI